MSHNPSNLLSDYMRRIAKETERDNPDALVSVMTDDGTFVFNSVSSEAILGFPPEYALGHNIAEFYEAREAAHILLTIQDALLNDESVATTRNSPRKSGGTRRVRGSMQRVVDKETGVAYVLSIALPVS